MSSLGPGGGRVSARLGGAVKWDTYGVDGGGEERLVDGVREPGEPDGDGGWEGGGGEAVDGEGWEEEEG